MLHLHKPAQLVGFEGEGDDRATLVLEIDGEEKTITLPDGWMHQDQVRDKYMPKDQFARELERRVAAKTKGLVKPDDLLSDEEFLAKLLGLEDNKAKAYDILGLKPGEPGKDVDVGELRKKIEGDLTTRIHEAEVKPREEKISSLEALVERLRERDFDATFTQAAIDVGVHEDMVEPVSALLRRQFRFDEEENGWFKLGEDGELEVNINPEPNGPRYMTPADVLAEIRRSGTKKSWFKAPAGGGGYQGGQRGGKRKVTFEEFKAMSDAQKRKLRDDDSETWQEMLKLQSEEGAKALYGER